MNLPTPTLEEYENVSNEEQALQIENRVREALKEHLPLNTTRNSVGFSNPSNESVNGYKFILALDIGYSTLSDLHVAVGILFDVQREKLIDQKILSQSINNFAYKPGFLAFRELPLLTKVAKQLIDQHQLLQERDVLLICDGNGTLHPRLCGIACHLGLLLNLPSIGVGKTYLIGNTKEEGKTSNSDHSDFNHLKTLVDTNRGSKLPIYVQDRLAGYMLRSQSNVKPIFVSSGYRISQDQACQIVLHLCSKFRQPEPIRIADHLGRMEIRKLEGEHE